MSKLLARAKVKRENAEMDYRNAHIDDAYIDDCCYNLQQSIEFCLKYIVEMNGQKYIPSHDIRVQLNKLNQMGVKLPSFFKKLRMYASTINSWEAESRYNDHFVGLIEDIEDVKIIADELIEYCDSLVTIKKPY